MLNSGDTVDISVWNLKLIDKMEINPTALSWNCVTSFL